MLFQRTSYAQFLRQKYGKNGVITPIKPKRVVGKAGEVLVFRQDLMHAGAGFLSSNLRIHRYFDVPNINRVNNTTMVLEVLCANPQIADNLFAAIDPSEE